jgi:hypothetical protein
MQEKDIVKIVDEVAARIRHKVSRLPREECVRVLTDVSIQCYDHESLETLREAVYINCIDGTIDVEEIG